MAEEIERKFLVIGDEYRRFPGQSFQQAYLCREPERTVRVRIAGDRGVLTVKSGTVGAVRREFEYEIPLLDAQQLLELCLPPQIHKKRFYVPVEGHVWEVDEFMGENQGLVIAEIELQTEADVFEKPDWVGREVTQDSRYYNSNLSLYPFQAWPVSEDSSLFDKE